MKRILCYGDSNTYGYVPGSGDRYPENVRWTGLLQQLLGNNYEIIEEGYNGRTTDYDDPADDQRNGTAKLNSILSLHESIDACIIMLGSNDVKRLFNGTAENSAKNTGKIIDIIRSEYKKTQGYEPAILVMSPPTISNVVLTGIFDGEFDERSIGESLKFSDSYKVMAKEKNCIFFNSAEVVNPSDIDGLHLEPESHRNLSEAVYKTIVSII